MYAWSCPDCMPRSPRHEHTSEEVEVAQREVPRVRIEVEPSLRPQHLADEADLSVRGKEPCAQKRTALRAWRERDQRVGVDLRGRAPEEGDALGVRLRRTDEVGEEAARHALLHGVADD